MIDLCTATTIQHWYNKWNFLKLSGNSTFLFLSIGPQTKSRNWRKIKFELFLTENLWKGIRVSLGMILRLFCQRRKQIMIFRGSRRFCEFCGIDLAIFYGYLCYCSNPYCPYETNFPSEHCEHIVRAWTITSFKSRYLPGFQKERQKASFC